MSSLFDKKPLEKETLGAILIIFLALAFILPNLLGYFSLPLFFLFSLGGLLISLFFPLSGILSSVFLITVFERFFTLQSFWIDKVEYKLYPLDFLMAGIIIGIIFQILKGKKKIILKRVDWLLLSFIFLNILYFIFSLLDSGQDKNLSFSVVKNYAFYPLFYFFIVFSADSKNELKKLIEFFLAGCLTIILFVVLGIVRGEGYWTDFTPLSTFGTRTLAFTHGLYLSLAFLIIFISTSLFPNFKKYQIWKWILLVWIIGILGTLMRHLWLGLALSIFIAFFFLQKQEKSKLFKLVIEYFSIFLIAFGLIFYLSSIFPQSHFSQKINRVTGVIETRSNSISTFQNDESFSWRELVWKNAFIAYKQHPIIGLGTGKRIYVEKEYYQDFIEIRNIHNSYFSIFFQLGILGISFFLAFLWQIIRLILKGLRTSKRPLFIILGSLLTFFFFVMLFQPYLETNLLAIFFWIILGITRTLGKDKKTL